MPLVGRGAAVHAAGGPTSEELANAYIHIGTDGSITLSFGGAEMGQGSKSGLAQILAEELGVDWPQITMVRQELVDPVVSYFTGGSSAVSGRYVRLRNAGAAAREMLIAAAMAANGDPESRQLHRAERRCHARAQRNEVGLRDAVHRRGVDARARRSPADRSREVPRHRQAGAACRPAGEGRRQRQVRHRHLVPEHGVRGDQALSDHRRDPCERAGEAVQCAGGGAVQGVRQPWCGGGGQRQCRRRGRDQHVARDATRQFAFRRAGRFRRPLPMSTAQRY